MPNHSFSEETFPNIWPEPLLAQLEAIPELCYSRLWCSKLRGLPALCTHPRTANNLQEYRNWAGFSLFKASILLLRKILPQAEPSASEATTVPAEVPGCKGQSEVSLICLTHHQRLRPLDRSFWPGPGGCLPRTVHRCVLDCHRPCVPAGTGWKSCAFYICSSQQQAPHTMVHESLQLLARATPLGKGL